MVTKAVSDQFGKGGIADQMIRFNGFPFLDKEDHQFNESGRCSLTAASTNPDNFTRSIARNEAERIVNTGFRFTYGRSR
jgi:hypothetical protein